MNTPSLSRPLRVSLIIASYRRIAMLRDTIASLAEMHLPRGVDVEVVVVDNDPGGGARDVLPELQRLGEGRFALRYVHETRTGLSHARNRGIDEARGDIVAFLDDDVYVAEHWLERVLECFERTQADCVGGRTLVHWEDAPDPALKACEQRLVALDMGEHDFEVRGPKLPGGGNAAFQRRVFERGFRFASELGRIGQVLLSGEDSDLFLRLRKSGHRIWYCAGASVRHRTGGERLKPKYIIRQKYWFGISYAVIDRRVHGTFPQACLAIARLSKLLLVSTPQFVLAKLAGNRPAALLAHCSLAKQWGYLRATVMPIRVTVKEELAERETAADVPALQLPPEPRDRNRAKERKGKGMKTAGASPIDLSP